MIDDDDDDNDDNDDDDDDDDGDELPSTMIATKMMDADAKKLHFRPSGHSVILENIPISQIKYSAGLKSKCEQII